MKPTTSLFSLATATPKKETSKAKTKPQVDLGKGYTQKIKRFLELRGIMETQKAELAMLDSELKSIGQEKFLDMFNTLHSRPDNFNLVAEAEKVLFMVTDKYLKVDEDKAELLKEFPGVLETTETYTFNPEVLALCGDAVSEAIMGSKKISVEHKAKLLIKTEETFIKKGTIDRLMDLGKKNYRRLFSLIAPVCQLKA